VWGRGGGGGGGGPGGGAWRSPGPGLEGRGGEGGQGRRLVPPHEGDRGRPAPPGPSLSDGRTVARPQGKGEGREGEESHRAGGEGREGPGRSPRGLTWRSAKVRAAAAGGERWQGLLSLGPSGSLTRRRGWGGHNGIHMLHPGEGGGHSSCLHCEPQTKWADEWRPNEYVWHRKNEARGSRKKPPQTENQRTGAEGKERNRRP